MMSWKALSLLVAAAVALNGVTGLEQGYGGGLTTAPETVAPDDSPVQSQSPAVTTATPTSTESSTTGEADDYPIDGDDGDEETVTDAPEVPSASGSDEIEIPGGEADGSDVEGSSAIDEGSGSVPMGKDDTFPTSDDGSYDDIPSGMDEDSNGMDTGSDVEGSSAIDEGSDSVPAGKGDTFPSETGSDVEGSSAIDEGSDSTYPDGEQGSDRSGEGGDEASAGEDSPTLPSGGCQVRRRLRQ